ncbi:MAG: ABC transporter ATP-binding protein [Bacteroidales bacterium]|nr:ABC transporter ATP-binding protein [Bacteroidales bacterium]MDD2323069.1 ABC transporter ATP-binding protein [Bacteroidales bacterium]MDD3011222.1 ABC transporter ATP-binding protein [Bacteroidales bacterium]MDD3962171.1 ABC transporter ATP-binding protein [Bacteroidales bacterium]MDY0285525.1 ABC transporter ATP-binding protein [Bacteroidales bacterium]
MLTARQIVKRYGTLEVLKGINLEVKKGEIISIVGASGAGKSTLLYILGILDRPDNGSLTIEKKDVFSLSDKQLSAFRNQHIGFVFQFHHLLPEFSALENIFIPALIAGKTRRQAEKQASELLEIMGLTARASHKPAALSGGEQQRVAIARALINNPGVILADEPSGNLDSENANDLHRLFFDLREKMNQTFIIVTHNQQLAAMADRKLTIQDGIFID